MVIVWTGDTGMGTTDVYKCYEHRSRLGRRADRHRRAGAGREWRARPRVERRSRDSAQFDAYDVGRRLRREHEHAHQSRRDSGTAQHFEPAKLVAVPQRKRHHRRDFQHIVPPQSRDPQVGSHADAQQPGALQRHSAAVGRQLRPGRPRHDLGCNLHLQPNHRHVFGQRPGRRFRRSARHQSGLFLRDRADLCSQPGYSIAFTVATSPVSGSEHLVDGTDAAGKDDTKYDQETSRFSAQEPPASKPPAR